MSQQGPGIFLQGLDTYNRDGLRLPSMRQTLKPPCSSSPPPPTSPPNFLLPLCTALLGLLSFAHALPLLCPCFAHTLPRARLLLGATTMVPALSNQKIARYMQDKARPNTRSDSIVLIHISLWWLLIFRQLSRSQLCFIRCLCMLNPLCCSHGVEAKTLPARHAISRCDLIL